MPDFLKTLITIVCLAGIGIAAAFYYVKLLKRHVLGGIVGACVIGVVGATLGGFALSGLVIALTKLGDITAGIVDLNLVSAFIGAFFLIWILSKITHK